MTDYNGRFIFHDNDDFALYATFETTESLIFEEDADDWVESTPPDGCDP